MRLLLAVAAVILLALPATASADSCVALNSTNWSLPATWSGCGGGIPTAGDTATIGLFDVQVDTPQTVDGLTLQNGGAGIVFTADTTLAIGTLTTNEGQISGTGTATVSGPLVKNGNGNINVASGADLILNGDSTLGQAGLNVNGAGSRIVLNATLTMAATISGSVPIAGIGGLLVVTGPNGKIVDQTDSATNSISTPIDNDGEVRAEGGALQLLGGDSGAVTTGTFVATAGDAIEFHATYTLDGSTAAITGAGTARFGAGTTRLEDGASLTPGAIETLSNVGGVDIDSTAGTYSADTITIRRGRINSEKDPTVGKPDLLEAHIGALSGDHTVNPDAFSKPASAGGTQWILGDGAELVIDEATSIGTGTICLQDSGGGDPLLRISATLSLVGPTAVPIASCNPGADDTPQVVIDPTGTIAMGTAGPLQIRSRVRNAGGTIDVDAGETLQFLGAVEQASGTIDVAPNGATLRVSPGLTHSGGTTTVAAGSTLESAAPSTISGGTLKVDGTLDDVGSTGAATLTSGGALTGGGTVDGHVTNTSGVIRPGTSPGHLKVDGSFTQAAGGTLEVEVDGPAQDTQYDRLEVTGQATLDGTLAVDRDAGFNPSSTAVFNVLTSGSTANGAFATTTGLALPGGRTWSVDQPTQDPFGSRLFVAGPSSPPTPGQPAIGGTPAVGQTLTCNPGTWGGGPSFTFEWLRGGQPFGATGAQYVVGSADQGTQISCRVTGTNADGSAQATSAPVSIPSASAPPSRPPPGPTATQPAGPPTSPALLPSSSPAVAPTAQERRLATASPAVVARALGLPPARRCQSRRRFVIRLREPHGVRLRSARVTVAGRTVMARRRGGRLTAFVDLRGLPRARFVVRIAATTVSQKTLRATRAYRTCRPKRR